MGEDKRAICEKLCEVLQMTRQCNDLISLDWSGYQTNCEEYVTASFIGGGRKIINVSMDSGIAMISDIVKMLR